MAAGWGVAFVFGAAAAVAVAAPAPSGLAARDGAPCGTTIDGLCVYFGDLHAHTSYSDGELTPAGAYFYARTTGGLDFLGLSDHAYALNGRPDHVADLLEQARRGTEPGRFVALAGAEWTESAQGHVNVFGWEAFPDRERQPDYASLYRWLAGHPLLFAQLNHPGFDIQKNWDAFRYDVRADRYVELLEVGSGPFPHNTRYEPSYQLALDRGWHVGAANNSDAHRAQWGTATPSRTAVWSQALTPDAIVEAVRERRTYATEDPDAVLAFRSGSAWMGTRLDGGRERASFIVQLWDPDPGDGFDRLQLVGPGGSVVRELSAHGARRLSATLDVRVPQPWAWYYVRAVQQDGDVLVSSPIWFEPASGVRAVEIRSPGTLKVAGRTYPVRANLINDGDDPVEVQVRWEGPGVPVAPLAMTLPPASTEAIEATWTPARAGVQTVRLEVRVAGGREVDQYALPIPVRDRVQGRLAVDEGHNNRYTGLAAAWLQRLEEAGIEAAVAGGPITPEGLAGLDVFFVAAPQAGFSLTRQTFTQAELAALSSFVRSGGSLVLAGDAGEGPDGGHGVRELNRILAVLESVLRFEPGSLPAGPSEGEPDARPDPDARIVRLAGGALVDDGGSPFGPLSPPFVYLRRAAAVGSTSGPLRPGAVPPGVTVLAWGESTGRGGDEGTGLVPVAVEQDIGSGMVVLIAAPTFSPYEYNQRGTGNVGFEDRLVARLLAR